MTRGGAGAPLPGRARDASLLFKYWMRQSANYELIRRSCDFRSADETVSVFSLTDAEDDDGNGGGGGNRTVPTKIPITTRGVARNLFRRGTKPGNWGQKSPSGVQGAEPWWESGAKLKIYMLKHHCNNVLTKNLYFSTWEFLGGGDMSPLSPLPYAPVR